MKQNAMTDAAKLQRRQDFIIAAQRLFLQQRRLPAVADIAADTGLAKGTVYRYFRSKEEIFIALLQAEFATLFSALHDIISALPAAPDKAATRFATAYCQQLQQLPALLPLAAMLNAVLEHKLALPVLKQFKQMLAGALTQLGQLLAAKVKVVSAEQSADLLLRSYALTLGLWQTLQYPPAVQALLQQEPELQSLQRDFNAELTQAISQLWSGAFA